MVCGVPQLVNDDYRARTLLGDASPARCSVYAGARRRIRAARVEGGLPSVDTNRELIFVRRRRREFSAAAAHEAGPVRRLDWRFQETRAAWVRNVKSGGATATVASRPPKKS
jgi:hypothetical protein